jgi:hypothetical protein
VLLISSSSERMKPGPIFGLFQTWTSINVCYLNRSHRALTAKHQNIEYKQARAVENEKRHRLVREKHEGRMSDLHARNYRDVPHKYNSKNRKCVASFLSLRKQTASVKPTQVSLFPNGKYANDRSYIFHWQKTNFCPLKAIDEKYAFS